MITLYNYENTNIGINNGNLFIDSVLLDDNTLYVCCPYGIGDTLYVAALIDSYKSYYSINKDICLIVKDKHSFIPNYFDSIDKVIASDNLVNLLNHFSITTQTWRLENYLYGHFKKSEYRVLYSEYYTTPNKCMIQRYKQLVFGIPLNSTLCKPSFKELILPESYSLDKNTIILMPYAMSTPLLPSFFWDLLAQILNRLGYHLYTNVKDETEAPINGTFPLSCSLEEIITISEPCFAVISLRSGICDLLAYTNTHLIIINTDVQLHTEWDLTTIHDREGIANLLCTDIHNISSLAEEILSFLGISL